MLSVVSKHPAYHVVVTSVLIAFVALIMDATLASSSAYAACDRAELDSAADHFNVADFRQALEIVDRMLAVCDLQGTLERDTYLLKARCHSGLNEPYSTVDAFCSVIGADPEWRPDPDFYTRAEIEAFQQAQVSGCATVETKKEEVDDGGGGIPTWVWYATAGAGAVVLALVLAGGDDGGGNGDGDLPDFPPPPN
jgi:hypothetical protein